MSDIRTVSVIGTGTMGRGIAQVAAQAGFRTALFDADPAQAGAALEAIAATLEKGVAKGKLAPDARARTLENLATAGSLAEAARADLVIEAVPELAELKRELFAALDAASAADAILASNTSSIPIARIAAAVKNPGRVVGMHFFNPVHLMPLLEVVWHPATAPEVLAAACAAGRAMGKSCIRVKDSPGFASSRLGLAIGLEAMRMVEEDVASPADIDAAMELGYRHPMGPLKLSDLVGLDVRLAIARTLHAELRTDRFKPPALLERWVAQGRLGKKSGRGFYRWDGDTAVAETP